MFPVQGNHTGKNLYSGEKCYLWVGSVQGKTYSGPVGILKSQDDLDRQRTERFEFHSGFGLLDEHGATIVVNKLNTERKLGASNLHLSVFKRSGRTDVAINGTRYFGGIYGLGIRRTRLECRFDMQ